MTCSTCRHWHSPVRGDHMFGECRRRAPLADHAGNTIWPTTVMDDCCGEFEAPTPLRGKYEVEIGEGKMKVVGFRLATQPGSPDEPQVKREPGQ